MANDLILAVNLKQKLRFNEVITNTNPTPYIVIFCKEGQVCVIMELTVCGNKRIEKAPERTQSWLINPKKTVEKLGVFNLRSAVAGSHSHSQEGC